MRGDQSQEPRTTSSASPSCTQIRQTLFCLHINVRQTQTLCLRIGYPLQVQSLHNSNSATTCRPPENTPVKHGTDNSTHEALYHCCSSVVMIIRAPKNHYQDPHILHVCIIAPADHKNHFGKPTCIVVRPNMWLQCITRFVARKALLPQAATLCCSLHL